MTGKLTIILMTIMTLTFFDNATEARASEVNINSTNTIEYMSYEEMIKNKEVSEEIEPIKAWETNEKGELVEVQPKSVQKNTGIIMPMAPPKDQLLTPFHIIVQQLILGIDNLIN